MIVFEHYTRTILATGVMSPCPCGRFKYLSLRRTGKARIETLLRPMTLDITRVVIVAESVGEFCYGQM